MSNEKEVLKFVPHNKEQKTFYKTLNKRVNQYFKEKNLSKKANAEMVIKTIVMLSLYIVPFVLFLWLQPGLGLTIALWSIMGFGMAGVGMSVMHDAIHGAYSQSKKINNWMGYSLSILGGTRLNWYLQHNVLHHTYTNISNWDEDIDGKGVLRLEPHKDNQKHHHGQRWYALFLYSILTLYWMLAKDFVQFYRYTKRGINKKQPSENRKIFSRIILHKAVYVFVMLLLPTVVFSIPFLYTLAGFLTMHFIGGIVLTTVFQLAHSVEGTTHPLPDEEGQIDNDWAIHQMETTVNFARHNPFLNWYLGGLNFQVEHHLFPHICHVHYPAIAPIVKSTAEEFNVPYLENPTLGQALKNHWILLSKFGHLPDLNEGPG